MYSSRALFSCFPKYSLNFSGVAPVNHQRNQLLREVIRTIVVGATGNGHRQAVGTVVSQNQQVSGSLGATVRRAGVDRSFLGEEQIRTIQRQVTVNFIGRNLMVTLNAVLAASIHCSL